MAHSQGYWLLRMARRLSPNVDGGLRYRRCHPRICLSGFESRQDRGQDRRISAEKSRLPPARLSACYPMREQPPRRNRYWNPAKRTLTSRDGRTENNFPINYSLSRGAVPTRHLIMAREFRRTKRRTSLAQTPTRVSK